MSGWSTGALESVLTTMQTDFTACFINIYSGAKPASSDTGATGTLLATITLDGDGVTGISWDTPSGKVMSKPAAAVWRYTGLADGTAGYFRMFEATDTPANTSTTAIRYDGTVGRTTGELQISSTTIVTGAPGTVDTATITLS
jgi:hypothetical protein